jgi:hypothetical protein
MQFSLFYDYFAVIDSCSFYKKYNARSQAFVLVSGQPDFPVFDRKGYPHAASFKALIYAYLTFDILCFAAYLLNLNTVELHF